MKKLIYSVFIFLFVFNLINIWPALAQTEIPDSSQFGPSEADIPKGPENIPQMPSGDYGPQIGKPEIPGIPREARDMISDKDFIEIYCLMTRWKAGEFLATLDSLEKNLIPKVTLAENFIGNLNAPDITAVRSQAEAKINQICASATVEDANAGLNELSAYGETVRAEFVRLGEDMSTKLSAKGKELETKIKTGLEPLIAEVKASAEAELKALAESLVAQAQSDIEAEMSSKKFTSAASAQAYAQSRISSQQSNIMNQVKARAEVLKKEIEVKIGAKVDDLAGPEKAKYESLAKDLNGLEKTINDGISANKAQYEQYKKAAYAKRQAVIMDLIDKNIAKAKAELENNRQRFEEAKKENPDIKTIEDVISEMDADRQAVAAKVAAAISSENEPGIQTAIDEFRTKWESYRSNLEKAFFNSQVICSKAGEQFVGAKSQIDIGLLKIKAVVDKCKADVSEECLKVNSFAPRFKNLSGKIETISEQIGSIEKMCQNPQSVDPENLVSLLKKMKEDSLDLESYGKALEAEKLVIIADTIKLVCGQILPQLDAAKIELRANDLSDLESNLNRCKGKQTEECGVINKATEEFNQLKTKITKFTGQVEKVQSLCAAAKGEAEFMEIRDLAQFLKSQGEQIKLQAKELKQKQAEKANKKTICAAALPRLEIAKKEISRGISESKAVLAECKNKTDNRCQKINSVSNNFETMTSKAQQTLERIAKIGASCDKVKNEMADQSFLDELDAIRAAEKEIKDLVSQLKAEENKEWPLYILSGKGFKVVFDVSPSLFDDSQYTGDWKTDPMGTIRGGDTYTLNYNVNNGWTATGYNEGAKRTGSWTYQYGDPNRFELDIWGRVYKFDAEGNVYDPQYGLVGHLIK